MKILFLKRFVKVSLNIKPPVGRAVVDAIFPQYNFCYNSSVLNFCIASEMVSAGKGQSNSVLRARQSKLLTWSDKIAPVTGNPAGIRTSKG